MALKTYRELEVWQKAMDLVVSVYRLSGELPATEKYGLASQLQRSAVSIPANIAEGYGRSHRGEYLTAGRVSGSGFRVSGMAAPRIGQWR